MTLHPWPSNDDPAHTHQPVLWTAAGAVGLLIDTSAVPLRFGTESESMPPAAAGPTAHRLRTRHAAALLRIKRLEALLNACETVSG